MVYGNVRKARGHHLFRRSPARRPRAVTKHAPGQREVGGKFPILVFGHEALLQGKGDGGVGPVGIQLALVKIQGLGAPVHPGVLGGEVELARLGGDAPAARTVPPLTSSKPWDCSWVSSRSSPWAVEAPSHGPG